MIARAVPCLLALAAMALPCPAQGQDRKAQFRQLTLVDGRQFTAEILSTEPVGLRLRTPAGEALVSFELLVDMIPVDRDAFENQPNFRVYVATPLEHREQIGEAYGWVKGVDVFFSGDPVPGLSEAQSAQAVACGTDFSCLMDATSGATEWMHVVSLSSTESGDLKLFGGLTGGSTSIKAEFPDTRDGRWLAVHESVMITAPDDGAPKPQKPPKPDKPPRDGDTSSGQAASFVPLPGYPSFKQGDAAGGLVAIAIAVPTSTVLVGAAGHGGQSVSQTAIVASIGTYAATVIANSIGGKISQRK